jgi:hypothetical protein
MRVTLRLVEFDDGKGCCHTEEDYGESGQDNPASAPTRYREAARAGDG